MGLRKRCAGAALPLPLRRLGAALLEAQMWCFGCDVRSAHGNLLVQYGFRRVASPDPRFHSAYEHDNGLKLWSWGLWMSKNSGSLYVPRQHFELFYTPCVVTPRIWQPNDLPEMLAGPAAVEDHPAWLLLGALCDAVCAYEMWICETLGSAYRQQAIDSQPAPRARKDISAQNLVSHWQCISAGVTPCPVRIV
jgi:hypothetical protein